MSPPDLSSDDRQRLDKWLWYARVLKSRTLAAKLVEDGHVRVNAVRVDNPAKSVRPGDVLTVALDRDVRVLKVLASGERRGPYPEARLLYEDLSFSSESTSASVEGRAASPSPRLRGEGGR